MVRGSTIRTPNPPSHRRTRLKTPPKTVNEGEPPPRKASQTLKDSGHPLAHHPSSNPSQAKKTAKSDPKFVVSDGLPAYIKAFKTEFYTISKPRVQHIRKPRFIDHTNNNIVDRLNGTVRKREKVMRGMKGDETAEELMEGFRTYYNFIRPHMSLDGQTPAEVSNIELKLGENKCARAISSSK